MVNGGTLLTLISLCKSPNTSLSSYVYLPLHVSGLL